MFEAVYVRDHDPNLAGQVMSCTMFAMLQQHAPNLAEAITNERINLDQAMQEFQARASKQAALRSAEKRVRELREQGVNADSSA